MDPATLLVALLVVSVLVWALFLGFVGLLGYRLIGRAGQGWLAFQAAFMLPGPRREVVRLRVQLTREVRGARKALSTIDANGATRGELAILVRRLERLAQTLDSQLRLLSCEPDEEMLRGFLRLARQRVEEFVGATRRIRQVALAVLGGETDDTLHRLTSDVDREVLALQAGVDALQALTPRQLEDKH
ncbi:MAG: hypothetical protein M1358_00270 [Chloroflexi bacterium]|nr:hypothetical protein [Chloroflexota bacterium]